MATRVRTKKIVSKAARRARIALWSRTKSDDAGCGGVAFSSEGSPQIPRNFAQRFFESKLAYIQRTKSFPLVAGTSPRECFQRVFLLVLAPRSPFPVVAQGISPWLQVV